MCNCQQFELYASEASVPIRGRTFAGEQDMQAWLDGLRDTWWWTLWYSGVKRVDVFKRRSDGSGSVGAWVPERAAGQMEMAPVHCCEQYLLHELSHVLADYRYNSHAHDPWFARTYLELVAVVMGPEAYVQLHAAFERDNIQHDVAYDDVYPGSIRPIPLEAAS